MAEKKVISAKQVVADIKAGMSDDELMQKYGVSSKGLQSLFDKLVKANLLSRAEYQQRLSSAEQPVELVDEAGEKIVLPSARSLDVLRDFGEKFKFSKEDLERLKTASIKDIQELMEKYNISFSNVKDLLQSLGINASRVVEITDKIKESTKKLVDKVLELPSEKSLEVLRGFGEKFKFSKEDLERLKTASTKEITELMEKYNISLGSAKNLLTSLGDRIKEGTRREADKVLVQAPPGQPDVPAGSSVSPGREPAGSVAAAAQWFDNGKILIPLLVFSPFIGVYPLYKTSLLRRNAKIIILAVIVVLAVVSRTILDIWLFCSIGAGIGYLLYRFVPLKKLGFMLYSSLGYLGTLFKKKSGDTGKSEIPPLSGQPVQGEEGTESQQRGIAIRPKSAMGPFHRIKAVPAALPGFFVSLISGQFLLRLVGYLVVLGLFALSIAAISHRHEMNLLREAKSWARVDPLPKAEELYKAGQICDALEYLEYFRDFDYVKENQEVTKFYEKIKAERDSLVFRAKEVGMGIWKGKGACPEAILSATFSDLVGVGSVRTLGEWGWAKSHGEKTDDLAGALALVDVGCTTWTVGAFALTVGTGGAAAPAGVAAVGAATPVKTTVTGLRIAEKLGKLSAHFKKALTMIFVKAYKEKSVKPITSVVTSINRIRKVPGLKGRDFFTVMSHAKDPKDLERLSKVAHAFGDNTGKFLTLGGDKSLQVHSRFHNDPQMVPALNHALQYGDKGTNAVMKLGPTKYLQAVAPNKLVMGTRIGRSLWEGHLTKMLMYILNLFPGWVIYLIAMVSGLIVIGIPSAGLYRAWRWLQTPA